MPPIRSSSECGLLALAAVLGAVALASIVRPAHVESPAASTAYQREDHELVHPARKDENWTTASATCTVLMYWLSIRRPYTRVQAPTWTLLRFSALATYPKASSAATSPPFGRGLTRYFLDNWRKHREDQGELSGTWLVDPFSSAILFPGWAEMADRATMWPLREAYDPMLVFRPTCWLLREGYLRGGGPISAREVPGERR